MKLIRIIKNGEVTSEQIKFLKSSILNDKKEVKYFLGINSTNIIDVLPLKNRDFELWIVCIVNEIIGFISFTRESDLEGYFIKEMYILPTFRNEGYGKKILKLLYDEHPKLCCKINPPLSQNDKPNIAMYNLVKTIGMRGEKSIMSFAKGKNDPPIWWSNYKEDKEYV